MFSAESCVLNSESITLFAIVKNLLKYRNMIVYCFNIVTEEIQLACSINYFPEHSSPNFLLTICSSEGRSVCITLQKNRCESM